MACQRLIIYLIVAVFAIGTNGAEPVPWKKEQMSTTVNEQPLVDFIKDFAGSQDVSVSVSEEVNGTVNASFTDEQPAVIFNSVMKAYGLVPYYDGSILYIYEASEMKSSVIALNKLGTGEYKTLLEKLQVFDDSFTFRELEEQGIVYASGPPRYVDLLEELATKFDERVVQKASVEIQEKEVAEAKIEVRYFPLKYAQADDTLIDFNDREITIPGVARLLSHVLGEGGPQLRDPEGKTSAAKPKTVERLKGQGLVEGEIPVRLNQDTEGERAIIEETQEYAEEKSQAEAQQKQTRSFVQADTRLNAVIVADRAERMPLYEKLIKDLDQPAGVVEINAAIIDMNANANLDWGVEYQTENTEFLRYDHRGAPSATGTFRSGQNTGSALVDGVGLVTGGGLNTSALLVGSTWQILARIRALEDAGEAQVLSRPSVITIDNTEAILRDDQTIYIRVAGQEEVDLFPVSAGVMLRVTPHLIQATNPGELNKIRLQVKIEDGDFSSEGAVDAIPVVRRSEITTQAVVAENESLLIGGQYRHEQSNGERRVPVAGRIPIIGNAFKNKRVVNSKRQRLFLISPNIIDPDHYYRKAEEITREVMKEPTLQESKLQAVPTFEKNPVKEKPGLFKRLFGPK